MQMGIFTPLTIQNVVMVVEGLELRIQSKDVLHFKYVKGESKFMKESDCFECELEDEVDLESALRKMRPKKLPNSNPTKKRGR